MPFDLHFHFFRLFILLLHLLHLHITLLLLLLLIHLLLLIRGLRLLDLLSGATIQVVLLDHHFVELYVIRVHVSELLQVISGLLQYAALPLRRLRFHFEINKFYYTYILIYRSY